MKRIITDNKFVMIETRLLSRQYSSSFLDDIEWRKLLHFNLRNDFRTGASNTGRKHFLNYSKISPKQYKKVMANLESKKLITTKPSGKRNTTTTLKISPIFNPITNAAYSISNQNKNGESMSFNKQHFAMVPSLVLDKLLKDESLTVTHIRLMLKLYRYNDYQSFNGVDSNTIHRSKEKVFICPRLLNDLQISHEEMLFYLEDLEKGGYFFWNKVFIYSEEFDMDLRYRVDDKNDDKNKNEVEIITPTYQYFVED